MFLAKINVVSELQICFDQGRKSTKGASRKTKLGSVGTLDSIKLFLPLCVAHAKQ